MHHSRVRGSQHARRSASENGTQTLGCDRAPSNVVRSRSAPRSTQLPPPPTPAEALARAQLLLDFPPAVEKLDEWRATIRSLVGIANKDEPRPAGPSCRRSVEPAHASGGRTGAAATMVHSPPPHQQQQPPAHRVDDCDNVSTASSDPRARYDQRQVLRERGREDARTIIERRREARHQSDWHAGPAMDRPTPRGSGDLPYEVGYPALTRELRQFH